MDDLDKLLVPESDDAGQTDEPAISTAPPADDDDEPGITAPEAAPAEGTPEAGQGQANSEGEMIPKSQYDSLRVDYTRKSMELADLKRRPQAQAPVAELPAADAAPQRQGIQGFIQAEIARGLEEAMAPLAEQQRTLEIQTTVVGLSEKYSDDFDKVSPDFIKALEENPDVLDIENGLEILFKSVRSDYLEKAAEANAIARQQAKQKNTQQKLLVNDPSNIAANRPDSGTSDEDSVKQSIMSIAGGGSIFKF